MSIITSLLHANYKEILMTRFCNQTKPILKACIYLFMLPWKWHTHEPNCQKNKVCVVNLVAAIFGDQKMKGFREKGK